MEVDKRAFDVFCFYLFPPIIVTVIQKTKGHVLSAYGSWAGGSGHQEGGNELIAIKQIGELPFLNLIKTTMQ